MSREKILLLLTSVLIISQLTGCENSLEPLDKDTGIYSVYGAIDLNKDTNEIRIRDLNVPFIEDATANIDAKVVLKNLKSGLKETLNSERFFEEGVYHHNFIVTQDIKTNTDYQLTVTRSDGEEVNLTTTTPTYATPVAEPINEQCYTPIEVTFEPLYESSIAFFIEFRTFFVPATQLGPFVIRRESENKNQATYTFTPVELVRMVPGSLGRYRCSDMIEPQFKFVYGHYSSGFYEFIVDNPFNAFESTQRFDAFYRDTLIIPIDAARVCPPDCL